MYPETHYKERSFFSRVFFNMTWALALTGLVAYGVASYAPFQRAILYNPMGLLILMGLELLLVVFLSRRVMVMSIGAATLGLVAFALVNGVTLASIFWYYTPVSIFTVFFIAAGIFLVTAAFGALTKIDLSPMGRFLFMSVIGIILASVVNLFLRSTGLMYIVSFVGVFIFSGLTAYDLQRLKRMNESAGLSPEQTEKAAIMGALTLYLDFINLFLSLIRIFGRRR